MAHTRSRPMVATSARACPSRMMSSSTAPDAVPNRFHQRLDFASPQGYLLPRGQCPQATPGPGDARPRQPRGLGRIARHVAASQAAKMTLLSTSVGPM